MCGWLEECIIVGLRLFTGYGEDGNCAVLGDGLISSAGDFDGTNEIILLGASELRFIGAVLV
jgi:hypothetical protein